MKNFINMAVGEFNAVGVIGALMLGLLVGRWVEKAVYEQEVRVVCRQVENLQQRVATATCNVRAEREHLYAEIERRLDQQHAAEREARNHQFRVWELERRLRRHEGPMMREIVPAIVPPAPAVAPVDDPATDAELMALWE